MDIIAFMNKRNFQREMEQVINSFGESEVPSLLLHACCAPCSSYCLEYLSGIFKITVFFYNPNITEEKEYEKRVEEEKRLIMSMPTVHPVSFIEGRYRPEEFFAAAKGLEREPEGGARCEQCFKLRLREAARVGAERGFDYFTTSLTISPLKNAPLLNEVGEQAGKEYGIRFLNSDFKKKNGYKRSIELSAEYGLYRQNYCGCVFSREQRNRVSGGRDSG